MRIIGIAIVGSNGVIGDGHSQPFQIAELEAAIATYFDGVPGDAGGEEVEPNLQQLPSVKAVNP